MSTTETVTTASMPVDAVKTKPTKLNYVKLPQTSFSPGTASAFRREHDVRDVHITDARSVKTPFDFNKHGFKFLEYPRGEQDIANEQKVKANMYPEIIELLKKE